MTFDLATESRRLDKKVASLRGKDALPIGLVELLAKARKLQLKARAQAVPVSIPDPDRCDAASHAQGAPLLPRHSFAVDAERASALMDALKDLAREQGGALARSVQLLEEAEREGVFDRKEAFARFIADDADHFARLCELTPEAPRLIPFLVQASATPFVEVMAEAVVGEAGLGSVWQHGHCPVCGSLPLIGRLLEKEGHRSLVCSFCHSEYRTRRLQCPYCLEEDMEKLEYFDSPDEPGYMVNVCRSCNGYIKTADFRKLDKPSLPLFDDLESLALDMLASQKGLTRPTLSAWGF